MGTDGHLEVLDDVIGAMLSQGTTVVPTCTVWYRAAYDDLAHMSEDRKRMRAVRDERSAAWADMHRSGIRFAAGPDTGVDDTYWENFVWELDLMVQKVGFTTMDAITAATRNAAIALGMDQEIGTLEPGKVADLLLVEGDPLADLAALRQVNRVFRAGSVVVENGHLVTP